MHVVLEKWMYTCKEKKKLIPLPFTYTTVYKNYSSTKLRTKTRKQKTSM